MSDRHTYRQKTLTFLKNNISKLHQIFCACYVQPWLALHLATKQYILYLWLVDDVVFAHGNRMP